MTVPSPSTTLGAPNYFTLKRREIVHRIHLTKFNANSFNPCAGQATRFAPIQDNKGNCVPSLYAGSSFDAAVYETLFHDIPVNAIYKTIPRQNVLNRSHGELMVVRQMYLVQLRNPDLLIWNIQREELIGTSAMHYSQTAPWAEAIHHQFPKADGLIWTSNQCDPDAAYLFFGDRVGAKHFKLIQTRNGATDPSFLADVRRSGRRSRITITL